MPLFLTGTSIAKSSRPIKVALTVLANAITFARTSTTEAEVGDTSEYCIAWAFTGECSRNSEYMLEACPRSCAGQAHAVQAASDLRDTTLARAALDAPSGSAITVREAAAAGSDTNSGDELSCSNGIGDLSASGCGSRSDGTGMVSATDGEETGDASDEHLALERCKESQARLEREAHEREQRLWKKADNAIAAERKATERLKACEERDSQALVNKALEQKEKEHEAAIDQWMEIHRRNLSKAAQLMEKRDFAHMEALRAAKDKLREVEGRLSRVVAGDDLRECERRKSLHAEEASEFDRARSDLHERYLRFVKESRDREQSLHEALRLAELNLNESRAREEALLDLLNKSRTAGDGPSESVNNDTRSSDFSRRSKDALVEAESTRPLGWSWRVIEGADSESSTKHAVALAVTPETEAVSALSRAQGLLGNFVMSIFGSRI
eukprot:TRINITY_DN51207_c0_g1_i1.p1 TRINITY_DN51207_c0_g1~~TRINITY_DN51207_c0_g1_i1.p1  ORF type:complete len:460 (+),score=71.28 TRINITY_DN51207_c0_g1_i1:58-1380(+)